MERVRRDESTYREKYTRSVESRKSPFKYDVKSLAWVITYDGKPFDLELVLIVISPVWIAILLGFAVNVCCCRKKPETTSHLRRPRISLGALQQTRMEQKYSQPGISLDFYARKFIIQVNDPYVDIDAIFKNDRERGVRNRWSLARQVPKWIAWYRKHSAPPAPSPPLEQSQQGPIDFEEEMEDYKSKIWKP